MKIIKITIREVSPYIKYRFFYAVIMLLVDSNIEEVEKLSNFKTVNNYMIQIVPEHLVLERP
jgi:hypothetical protein